MNHMGPNVVGRSCYTPLRNEIQYKVANVPLLPIAGCIMSIYMNSIPSYLVGHGRFLAL